MTEIAARQDPDRRRDKIVSRWLARLDRKLSDDEVDELLRWARQDCGNEKRLLELARLWDRMDVLALVPNLLPSPFPAE